MLSPITQEETTGCGIAACAVILGKTYPQMKTIANAMGVHAQDQSLWSDTQYVRQMLSKHGVQTATNETPFESWQALPALALLAIKHHVDNGKPFWHWVVFSRQGNEALVFDSAMSRNSNIRTDFDAMTPKWFIEVKKD